MKFMSVMRMLAWGHLERHSSQKCICQSTSGSLQIEAEGTLDTEIEGYL